MVQMPTIWSIGGGKGGVGKSLLAANLGVALAQRGTRVILVDADLGGANLHTYLGLPHPQRTLADYLLRRVGRLEEVLLPTGIPTLWMVPASSDALGLANPRYQQKQRLIQALRGLEAEVILLDLGAGTHFTVLDFFNAAHLGVAVCCPEPAAIQSAYGFLKQALFRRLQRAFSQDTVVSEWLRQVADPEQPGEIKTLSQLEGALEGLDPQLLDRFREVLQQFRAGVIINQAHGPRDRAVGAVLRNTAKRYLQVDLTVLGWIPRDAEVARSVRTLRPFVLEAPDCPATRQLIQVLDKILGIPLPAIPDLPEPEDPSPQEQSPAPGWGSSSSRGLTEGVWLGGERYQVQTEERGTPPQVETLVFHQGQVIFREIRPYPASLSPAAQSSFLREQHRTVVRRVRAGDPGVVRAAVAQIPR